MNVSYTSYVPSTAHFILKLSRFRKIDSLVLQLPVSSTVLLDGRTGIGKTTILEAISYVLYDDAGNSCYPRKDRNSKKKHDPTWVELTFPPNVILNKEPFVIYRQRRPNLLRIEGNGISLIDDSAQAYLNRIFGPLSSWQVGGYIKQGKICSFFTMSSNEKLSLIQEFAMPDQFEKLLQRTVDKVLEVTKQVQDAEMQVKVYQEMYLKMYNQCPEHIRTKSLWTQEQLQKQLDRYNVAPGQQQLQLLKSAVDRDMIEKVQQLQTRISEEQIKITKIKEGLKQRKQLEQIRENLEKDLEAFPESLEVQIRSLEIEIAQISEQIAIAQKSERRTQLLAAKSEIERRLDQIPDENSTYTLAQLDSYDRILSGPTVEQFDEQLKEIALAKEYQSKLFIYQKRQSLINELENVKNQLNQYPTASVTDELENINKRIWSLSLQQKKLTCPKCKCELYLNGSFLEEFCKICEISNETESMQQLQSLKSKYQQQENQYQQRGHIQKKHDELEIQISAINTETVPSKPKYGDYSPAILDSLLNDIQRDRNLRIQVPNIDVSDEKRKLTNFQERQRLIYDIDNISKELSALKLNESQPAEIQSLEKRRGEFYSRCQELRAKETRRISLQSNLNQINEQIKSCPSEEIDETNLINLQRELENFIKESRDLQDEIIAQIQLSQMIELYTYHDRYNKHYQELSQKLSSLQKIRATLITAEYVILDQVLSNINIILAEILDSLFIEPISVTLRSLKQLKTDDRIKPQINCEIFYQGAECSSITELSGGEQSRISLALTIAFSRFISVPFLLLDESLSTLDVVTKECTIDVIRKYLQGKLVLAVNHDTTAGVYDHVIKLD